MHDTGRPAPDGVLADTKNAGVASGMHASDATAFVQWVNVIVGGSVVYRFPGSDTLTDPTVQRLVASSREHNRSVWVQSDHSTNKAHEISSPDLWIPQGMRHPHLIDATTIAERIRLDINASLPTLTRLIILRSAFMIRLLSHAFILDRTHNQPRGYNICHAFDHVLNTTLSSALASALKHALDQSLALDEARALVAGWPLVIEHSADLDPARALERAEAHALRRAFEYAINATADSTRPKFGLDLGQVLGHVLDLDRELAVDSSASSLDLRRAVVGASVIDRGCEGIGGTNFYQIVGHALSRSISGVLLKHGDFNSLPTRFSKEFTAAASISGNNVVSPDVTADKLASALRAFKELIGSGPGGVPEAPWAARVSERLIQAPLPIHRAPRAVLPFRLSALCLAAEADAMEQRDLGDRFRELAAGATLLARRVAGDAPTSEVMLLSAE